MTQMAGTIENDTDGNQNPSSSQKTALAVCRLADLVRTESIPPDNYRKQPTFTQARDLSICLRVWIRSELQSASWTSCRDDLAWLTEARMERLEPLFPRSLGKPRVDDCRIPSGIIFLNRNGLRWRNSESVAAIGPRDCPNAAYGLPKTPCHRQVHRCRSGDFGRILSEPAVEAGSAIQR